MSKYVGNYKLESHGEEYRVEVYARGDVFEFEHEVYFDNDPNGIRLIGTADSETGAKELIEWWVLG